MRDRIASSRRKARWGLWFGAWTVAESIAHLCNQWHLETVPASQRRTLMLKPATPYQQAGFEQLVRSVHRTFRRTADFYIGLGRGTQTLHSLLDQFDSKWDVDSHKGVFEPTGLVAAKEIDVATLRLPVRAGQLDTAALLPAQDRRTF